MRILWRGTGQCAFLWDGRELPQGSKPNEGGLGVLGEGTGTCFFLAIAEEKAMMDKLYSQMVEELRCEQMRTQEEKMGPGLS